MEITQDSLNSKHHSGDESNGAGEESCILVEEDISTIEIDDTIVDNSKMLEDRDLNTSESAPNLSKENTESSELILDDFQIVDETGSFDGEVAVSNGESNEDAELKVSRKCFNSTIALTVLFFFVRRSRQSFARQTMLTWMLHRYQL